MRCDKADVWFMDNGELEKVVLWDVVEDEDGNITGTRVLDDFPGYEEEVTIPACQVDAFFGEDFT